MNDSLIILGGGESGVGAAILGKTKGYDVFLSDKGMLKDEYKEALENEGIEYEEGLHSEYRILNAQLVVKSPGIPDKVDIIQKLKIRGIPIISEIEFAYRYIKDTSKIIAITGSNGKTTTTLLTYHLLKSGGADVTLGGNVGNSLAWEVSKKITEWYVLELSSFQLDDSPSFKPNISLLLNITPDHLDWYDYDMSKYIDSKFSIAKNQTTNDQFIFCLDDPNVYAHYKEYTISAQQIPYSLSTENRPGAFIKNEHLYLISDKTECIMNINDLALKGKHNVQNSMAAGMAALYAGIRKETIKLSLASFEAVPHRLEPVLKIQGVQYINDSKATNVNATYYALESMDRPTIWIVGGIDKGNDYSELTDLVQKKVKAIVCLGIDNKPIAKAFEDIVPVFVETSSMKEAVKTASVLAKNGDNVLLSPCCSSFDLFKNYEDRGNQFIEEVKSL